MAQKNMNDFVDDLAFCEKVKEWVREYQAQVEPGPLRFAVVSRRWAFYARRSGRFLKDVLSADGRFSFLMVKGGALLMTVSDETETERLAKINAMLSAD